MTRTGEGSEPERRHPPAHIATEVAWNAELVRGERFLTDAKYDQAEAAFEAALASGGDLAKVHHGLGRTFFSQGRIEDACDSLQLAVHYAPQNAAPWLDLALALAKAGDADQARQAAANAQALIVSAREWSELARAYKLMGMLADSVRCYERAFALDRNSAEFACQLGFVHFLAGDYPAAGAAFKDALDVHPEYAPALHNRGLLLLETGFPDEALASFEQAYAQAQRLESLACVAHALRDLGRLDAACAAYESLLEDHPQFGDAGINLAYALLMRGELEAGWHHYESRFAATHTPERDFGLERWRGGSLTGRRLLVHGEQGIGDEIMFASCMPDIIRLAARCVLACNRRLVPLFSRSFPGVQVHGMDDLADPAALAKLPRCDLQVPIGTLPRYLRPRAESFPGSAFLRADVNAVDSWRQRFGDDSRMRIGIAWRGGALRTRQWQRSTSLADWRALLTLPNCRFISLQHGGHHAELSAVARDLGVAIDDCQHVTSDIDQLAALVASLDLVLTVDNSLVHLSGALGQETWVLLCSAPEWRYPRRGERIPWFGSVRLFRGEAQGGAALALPKAFAALGDKLAGWSAGLVPAVR